MSKKPIKQPDPNNRSLVLQLTAEGKSAKEISKILRISPNTVQYHRIPRKIAFAPLAHTMADVIAAYDKNLLTFEEARQWIIKSRMWMAKEDALTPITNHINELAKHKIPTPEIE